MKFARMGLWAALALAAAPAAALEIEALLHWGQRVELATPLDGLVKAVAVQPGQRVAAGETLLELDRRLLEAQLEQARATLEEAEQQRAEVEREPPRPRGEGAKQERSQGEIRLARAMAVQRRAQAAVAEAELRLEYGLLRAPFDGVVVAVKVQPGELVVNGLKAQPLVVLARTDTMFVRALLNAEQVLQANPSGTAQVLLHGQRIEGSIRRIGLEPENPDGLGLLYQADVSFTPPASMQLRAGEPARVVFREIKEPKEIAREPGKEGNGKEGNGKEKDGGEESK